MKSVCTFRFDLAYYKNVAWQWKILQDPCKFFELVLEKPITKDILNLQILFLILTVTVKSMDYPDTPDWSGLYENFPSNYGFRNMKQSYQEHGYGYAFPKSRRHRVYFIDYGGQPAPARPVELILA